LRQSIALVFITTKHTITKRKY